MPRSEKIEFALVISIALTILGIIALLIPWRVSHSTMHGYSINKEILYTAAEAGFSHYQIHLGALCARGREPCSPQNYEESAKWYQRAADQGNREGYRSLGFLYLKGRGVKQSYDDAYFWLKMGTENFALESEEAALKEIASHLTKEQKEKIEKRICAWTPKESDNVTAMKARYRLSQRILLFLAVSIPFIFLGSAWMCLRKAVINIGPKLAIYLIIGTATFFTSFFLYAFRLSYTTLNSLNVYIY
jgi:TPR repeat protein